MRPTIFDIDLKLLKQSPWEHAHEIVEFYRIRSENFELAFIMLLRGEKDSEFVKTMAKVIHESRHEGMIQEYMQMRDKANAFDKAAK